MPKEVYENTDFSMYIVCLQSRSVSDPKGNKCTRNQDWEYFSDNETYTKAKCKLECLTKATEEQCHCSDAIVKGM